MKSFIYPILTGTIISRPKYTTTKKSGRKRTRCLSFLLLGTEDSCGETKKYKVRIRGLKALYNSLRLKNGSEVLVMGLFHPLEVYWSENAIEDGIENFMIAKSIRKSLLN